MHYSFYLRVLTLKKQQKTLIINSIIYQLHCSIFKFEYKIAEVGRVFTNGPGDLGSIPGCVIPKTLKMVHDTSLLNTKQYKVHIKGKVEQSGERSSAIPYTLML